MPLLFLASYVDDPARRGLIHLTLPQLRRNYSINTPDYERFTIHKQFGLDSCPSTVERAKGIKALKLRSSIVEEESVIGLHDSRLKAKGPAKMRRYMKRMTGRTQRHYDPVDLISTVKVQTPVIPPDMTEMHSQEYDPNPPAKPKAKKPTAKKPTAKKPAAKTKTAPAKAKKSKIGRANY